MLVTAACSLIDMFRRMDGSTRQHKEEMHVKAKKHSSTRCLWGLVRWNGNPWWDCWFAFDNGSQQDKKGQIVSAFPEADKINPHPNVPKLGRLKVSYGGERNTQISPWGTEGMWGGQPWALERPDSNNAWHLWIWKETHSEIGLS